MAVLTCPGEGRLRDLIAGKLATTEMLAVEDHIEKCPGCQGRLENVASAGYRLPKDLKDLNTDAPGLTSAYWPVAKQLGGSATPPSLDLSEATPVPEGRSGSVHADVPLDFLQPSDHPGSLGRLAHFEVMGVIGRGGMGIVLRGLDDSLQREVAIKVLDPSLSNNDTAERRFCREARTAASVTHENVVAIYQVHEDESSGLPYIVMQLVEGISLQERLDRGGMMPLRDIVRIGYQAASGLAAAHAKGLIHRDIKPANILLEDALGRVKLTDFGLARGMEDVKLTQTGFVAGTPLYMAPEQASGLPVDHRSDLFSLGSVLYAMAAGKPPFEGSTPFVVLKSVTEAKPARLKEINPDIPDWFQVFLDKLHAKSPADRYQTAQEVADTLAQAQVMIDDSHDSGLTTSAKGQSNLCEAIRESKKHSIRRKVAAIVSVSLALGGMVGFGLGRATGLAVPPSASRTQGEFAASDKPAGDPDLVPTQTLVSKEGAVWGVAAVKGTTLLVSAEDTGRVKIWDTAEGKVKLALKAHVGPVWAVDVSPDGKQLATAGEDGLVKLWALDDPSPEKPIQVFRTDNLSPVRAVKFDPEGQTLAAGTRLGKLFVWGCGDGAEARKPFPIQAHVGGLTSLAFSPDGKKIVTGGGDNRVRVWTAAGEEGLSPKGHDGAVYAVAFSPDGSHIASGSWDRTARVWDVATGEQLKKLEGHGGDVWSVGFCPAGKVLITGSEDRTARAWEWETGKELGRFNGHESTVTSVTFSPEGHYVATGSRDGKVRLWNPHCK